MILQIKKNNKKRKLIYQCNDLDREYGSLLHLLTLDLFSVSKKERMNKDILAIEEKFSNRFKALENLVSEC
ncbi:hypothetical protein AFAEC_1122 [Aliarcobacter faecis]|uniref:hypothetical protein n=1 Tax=Aliarcobacter faecis TaxID=1564138 RepID=UPI00047AC092|nr:hypothetical protein [Aliarcobacter faecis]QKF73283.1 hypothetical protein AFAEC_1117 [Aliarcobacter faecis]QKF73288.1 hypothetical protein AFAEC_1122 [Aliarcobacter faecis]